MIFDGIAKDYLRVNRELFRPPTPPIEYLTAPLANGGAIIRGKRFADADLTVPVTIRSKQRIEELKEDLSAWLVRDEVRKLEFRDMANRYYLAAYQGMDLDEYPHYAKGTINFYLPQGFRFGETLKFNLSPDFRPIIVGGQVSIPWSTRTVFTVPQSSFMIEASNGLYMLLNYNFIAGDVLEIDFEKRKVILNGNNLAVAVSMSSAWKELKPGYIQLKASHVTDLEYTERYY